MRCENCCRCRRGHRRERSRGDGWLVDPSYPQYVYRLRLVACSSCRVYISLLSVPADDQPRFAEELVTAILHDLFDQCEIELFGSGPSAAGYLRFEEMIHHDRQHISVSQG